MDYGTIPQIYNPLTDQQFLRFDVVSGKLVTESPEQSANTDIFAGIEKTINDNIPNYATALFGAILIAAGVYALAK